VVGVPQHSVTVQESSTSWIRRDFLPRTPVSVKIGPTRQISVGANESNAQK
jgi:hypothetical protein